MNAATFELTSTEERTGAKAITVARQGARNLQQESHEREGEARWVARAEQLLAAFDTDDLPTTSGKFGTFLV